MAAVYSVSVAAETKVPCMRQPCAHAGNDVSADPPSARPSSSSSAGDVHYTRMDGYVRALRREACDLREEVSVLRRCLEEAGILSRDAFCIQMHRLRFKAALSAHPTFQKLTFPEVLHLHSLALGIAMCIGPDAFSALGLTSKTMRDSALKAWPEVETVRDMTKGRIFVCGGSGDSAETLDSVEWFSTRTRSWEPLPHMLQRRCDASAHVLGGHLYVCGGSNGEGSMNPVLSSVERFNPLTRVWVHMPEMLFGRRGAAGGVMGGKLYICGGYNVTGALDLAECFDPSLDATWQAMPLMLEQRADPGAASIGNALIVCGGRGGSVWAQLSSVEFFDPGKNLWQPLPNMLQPRAGAAVATTANKLYVCGGMGNDVGTPTSVECFDMSMGVWEDVSSMLVARYCAAAAASGGRLYVFGGSHGWQQLQSAEQFDPEVGWWQPLPPMIEKRMSPAVAAFS
mmetsp:Transcript_27302/g.62886  ORF Transcript_27302/g.62886 Transcript_27302/m.62886 type:complete len:455 (+) Transcript_27302:40-1404(+)